MADNSVITSITDWLIDLSLADPDINVMFRKMCERMLAAGFPISRAMITYQTLHPVIENEMVVWKRGEGAEVRHGPLLALAWSRPDRRWGANSCKHLLAGVRFRTWHRPTPSRSTSTPASRSPT